MGRPEYPRPVRGVGFGVLPARSKPRSSTLATQDPALLQQVSVLTTRLAAQEATHQAQLAAQNDRMAIVRETQLAQLQILLESFMSNPGTRNPFSLNGIQGVHNVDTHYPGNVKQRLSVGSRPSELRAAFGDDYDDHDIAENERTF